METESSLLCQLQ